MTSPKKPRLRILIPASIIFVCGVGAIMTAFNGECTWQIVWGLGGSWGMTWGFFAMGDEIC